MNKRLIFILLAVSSFFSLGFDKNPHMPVSTITEPAGAQTGVIRLADLGYGEAIVLNGPYQETTASFSLPLDWKINGDILMELQVQVEFQSVMEAFTSGDSAYQPVNQEGVMQVLVNGVSIAKAIFKESGTQTLAFTLAADSLKENMAENAISISWDAAGACANNVTSYLEVSPESTIRIPYEAKPSEMVLTDFPKPFYDSTLIQSYPIAVILTNPSGESELSALMAVSAGLGKQSSGKLKYDVFTADEVLNKDLADDQIILIGQKSDVARFLGGKAAGLNDAISAAGEKKGAGFIWYSSSPWNPGRTMLVISGEDEPSLLKSSAVIASSDLVPYSDGNLAVISDLTSATGEEQLKIDYTLGDLRTNGNPLHVEGLGVTTLTIPFHVPGDVQVTSEAFLELYFRHSQLLNYLRSGLSVSINGRRIGTIRFNDNSAENGLTRILLPPNIILPQKNELELTFTLTGQDLCADQRSGDYWVTIFDQSYLHLPPELSVEAKTGGMAFHSLPGIFLKGKGMSDLTFISAGESFDNWRYASKMAFLLGGFSDEQILTPIATAVQALPAQSIPANVVLIGLKDGLPVQPEVSQWQPVPFNTSTAMDTLTINGTQFNVAAGNDYGFLELGVDPATGNHVLSVMGNTPAGLDNAFQSLQELLLSANKPTSNVRIIDRQGNIFEYFVERAAATIDAEAQQGQSWFKRLVSLDVNATAGLLLVVLGLITIVFVAWTIFDASRKRRKFK